MTLEELRFTDKEYQKSRHKPKLAVIDELHVKRTTRELGLQGKIPFAVYALGTRDLPYQMRHNKKRYMAFIHIHLQVVL